MRFTFSYGALVMLASAGLTAGCGSDGGGTGSVTTLSGTKALNGLSASESTQLCADSQAYVGRAISRPDACKSVAVLLTLIGSPASDAEAQMQCASAYNQCLASPSTATGQPDSCDPIPANCTATVAQYSACVTDDITATNQAFGAFPKCSALTLTSLAATNPGNLSTTPPASAACMTFATACPDFKPPVPN